MSVMKSTRLYTISNEDDERLVPLSTPQQKALQEKPKLPNDSLNTVNGTNTIVIASYHCCGSSTYANKKQDSKDLEADMYKFGVDGKVNPEYPANYLTAIKWHLVNNNWKYIFVSTKKEVLDALKKEDIPYVVLYPEVGRKDEIINLCRSRGNSDEFITGLSENYEKSIERLSSEPKSYALKPNEFINDELFETRLKFLKQ